VPSSLLQRAVSLLLTFALLAGSLTSQEITFSSNVKVVNVLATVREKNGNIVHHLTKDDFLLHEDGRPQQIRYFSQDTDLPLTIGLLVDTSLSQQNVLAEERAASHAFLNNMLRDQRLLADGSSSQADRAFVIQFDFEVELLQDVTSSRRELEAALDELTIPAADRRWGRARGGRSGGRRMPTGGGRGGTGIGTLLYDAVYLGAREVMSPQSGRKALIILSDGEDHGSKLSLEEGVEAAQRADTIIYTILFTDDDDGFVIRLGGRRSGREGKKVLQEMAKATGGRAFEVSRRMTIRQIYAQIEEELRNQYSLGYSSDRPDAGEGYRKISVTTRRKDLQVQARDGYYADRQAK
jgi:VWFA-related protein